MRVPSLWYDDGHGAEFHAKDKPLILDVIMNGNNINLLKGLILRPEWLRVDSGEFITDSMKLTMVLFDEYVREIPKLLKGCSWLNRLAIHRLGAFLVVLHRNDDMYYERFGYLMWRLIERYTEWSTTDKSKRLTILKEERALYLTHEKRMDRIEYITKFWDYGIHMYETDEGIERSVNFVIERLNVHKDMYKRDELSRLGLKAFYPEHWYPAGRGQLWDMMHGGKG
jgi:hypothetical protein